MTEQRAPMPLRPDLPAPDPGRVALLLALDPPENLAESATGEDAVAALWRSTIGGRPLTEAEREILGGVGYNDLAASEHAEYRELQRQEEMLDAGRRACAIAVRYGFGDGETLGDCRARMTAEDRAEFDVAADVAWPDGYIWLKGLGDRP